MKRRQFITALAGAAAWPLVAKAQQEKVWRVGYLSPASAKDEVSVAFLRLSDSSSRTWAMSRARILGST